MRRTWSQKVIPQKKAWTSPMAKCLNTVGSMVVAASTTVSTSKTFTYTTLLGECSIIPPSSPNQKVVISATTSVGGTGNLGAASLFAELVGQPFSAGAGATAEGHVPVCETVGVGANATLY